MNRKSLYISAVLAVAAIAAWNVNFNSQKSNFSDTMLANVEALASEAGGAYKWSSLRDCPGWGTGDYSACEANGTGNTCTTPGEVTCTCGVNCK